MDEWQGGDAPVDGNGGHDVDRRQLTGVVAAYSLTNHIDPDGSCTPLHATADFGRFARNLRASEPLLPRVVCRRDIGGSRLTVPGAGSEEWSVHEGQLLVLAAPRGDLALVMQVTLPGMPDADEVARFLAATCFHRDSMQLDGTPIVHLTCQGLHEAPAPAASTTLTFGTHVHQTVLPGNSLLDAVLGSGAGAGEADGGALGLLIGRGLLRHGATGHVTPRPLNAPGRTVAALVRGVSVLAGWSRPAENVMLLAPPLVVVGLEVLNRARAAAFQALEAVDAVSAPSIDEARLMVSDLSARLTDIELDMSFGVEAYIDSVLVPELFFESFLAALRDATGMAGGLDNTSRMVERVMTVLRVRRVSLDNLVAERAERRVRTISNIVAAGTVVAFPPTLLLAFFGVNSPDVDSSRSILDLSRYWLAYLCAFLPVIVLVATGYLQLVRLRRTTAFAPGAGPPVDARAAPPAVAPLERRARTPGDGVRAGAGAPVP
jgi:hypothetical protein